MSKFNEASRDAPPVDATGADAQAASERTSAGDARRAALRKIGKFSAYAAPAMLVVSSANAGPIGSD
jgi:hypothetical protein